MKMFVRIYKLEHFRIHFKRNLLTRNRNNNNIERMKTIKEKLNLVIVVIMVLPFLIACNNNSDSLDEPITGDYFPSNLNNLWNYSIENVSTTNPNLNSEFQDAIKVSNVDVNSFTLEVNNGGIAYGPVSTILASGDLTKFDSSLEYNGNLSLPILSEFVSTANSQIALADFVIYDLEADVDSELASLSNSITENIDFDGNAVATTISYTVSNTRKSNLNSLVVEDEVFNDVISTEIVIDLSVYLSFGVLVDQPLLEPQNVITITNYYAKDVGLIKSEANLSYSLNEGLINLLRLAGVTIDFETNGAINTTQQITSYSIDTNWLHN